MIYFDTSYLVRLYFADPGWEAVRQLAASGPLACGLLGRAETVSALHRKRREGSLSATAYQVVLAEFARDCEAGAFRWLPLSAAVVERVERTYAELAADVFLRAADALHLACAAENGFAEVCSNDAHLLAAAPYFGLRGVNVIQPQASWCEPRDGGPTPANVPKSFPNRETHGFRWTTTAPKTHHPTQRVMTPGDSAPALPAFLARWRTSGAAERANYALFLSELCDVLIFPAFDGPAGVLQASTTPDEDTKTKQIRPKV